MGSLVSEICGVAARNLELDMNMVLSILICHLPEREHFMDRLKSVLLPQIENHPEVEILIDPSGREMPTGTKRNLLMQRANGKYTVFIDVDDLVSSDYVERILEATKSDPDVITINGLYVEDNKWEKPWIMRLGQNYSDTKDFFYRWPNHISPMKKSLIQHIKFEDRWKGEDFEWSKKIHNMKLLKTEVHIPERIYRYEYLSNK